MRTPVLRFVPTRRIECERGPIRVRAIHPTDALELERFYAAETAEVAIAVADEFQHRGIGRRLMAAGAAWARRERIVRLTAIMLASNAPIHRLLMGLGAPTRLRYVGGGGAEITIDLTGQSVAAQAFAAIHAPIRHP